VNFSVSYVRFGPKVQKMGILQGKKNDEEWADISFLFFETPTSRTQKILLHSRNIPPNTPGIFLKKIKVFF
jgi:hypothetical protein